MLLIGLCVVGVALGRWQNTTRSQGTTDPVSQAARVIVGSPAASVDTTVGATRDFFAGWLRSGDLTRQNRRLSPLAQSAELYAARERDLLAEIQELRKLLAMPDYGGRQRTFGRIVGLFPYENRLTIRLIDGRGVRPGLPVVAAEGLVGVVQTVDGNTIQAMLLSAPTVRVGALIHSEPPQAGLLRGETPERLQLDLLEGDAEVRPGVWVVTSGYSDHIPRGIPIGRVLRVDTQAEFGERRVRILPAVRVAEVREVAVLR